MNFDFLDSAKVQNECEPLYIRRPRNILYLMDFFFGTCGGTEGQVMQLLKGINRQRYRPRFFCLQKSDFMLNDNFPCETRILNINNISRPSSIFKMLALSSYIYRSKIDLVHIFFNDSAIIAPLFCRMAKARVIASRRDMGCWYTPSKLKLLKFSNLYVDRIAVNSMAVKTNVSKHEAFPEDRIEVIYNGFDKNSMISNALQDFRKKFGIRPTDQIIGMVANLKPYKRHKDLIRALSIIHQHRDHVHLILIGDEDGSELNNLKKFIQKQNLKDKVHLLGNISNVIPVIKHFDVCVLCSDFEGLSNSIIEYMACAKPVVCTDVGGNPELIRHGDNGFLVEPRNVHCLAENILKLLANDGLRRSMGNNGRMICLSKFNKSKMVSAYMDMYDRVLKRTI